MTELKSRETERQEAINALSRSEKMQRSIFEFAPDSMIIVNSCGKIHKVNSQAEKMFGYMPEEIVGQPLLELMPERFHEIHQKYQKDFMENPNLREIGDSLELFALRKNGTEFPVDIILSPIRTDTETLIIAVIRDITRRKNDEKALLDYAERQKIISRRLLHVQEAERRHIALELHDEIGQLLTGLNLTLEMVARQNSAGDSITQAQNLVNELVAKVRKLSLDLRPATLDHLGLLPALLQNFRAYTSQTQIEVDFSQSGLKDKRFRPELETAAFRIVQEALTNIARHSGAKEAKVQIWVNKKNLTIEIEDKGKGFDVEAALSDGKSSGLTGMRERALLLGGDFKIESNSEKTRLTAEWSLEKNLELKVKFDEL